MTHTLDSGRGRTGLEIVLWINCGNGDGWLMAKTGKVGVRVWLI